jgi:hypothetical protein
MGTGGTDPSKIETITLLVILAKSGRPTWTPACDVRIVSDQEKRLLLALLSFFLI